MSIELHEAGWNPVPLPLGKKWPPETGRTGYKGRNLSAAEVRPRDWSTCSVAVRMPPDVIGIDVDAYNGGSNTLGELVTNYGELPPTVMTTARTDGSGIGFFRVPPGTTLVTAIPPGIELIQWFHRYATVAPSTNPNAGGAEYRWIDQQSGEILEAPPQVGELPELPWSWIDGLSASGKGRKAERGATPAQLTEFLEAHTSATFPAALKGVKSKLVSTPGGRHDSFLAAACWAMREARAGLYPAATAVGEFLDWWAGFDDKQEGEAVSMLLWAVAEAAAEDQDRIDGIAAKARSSDGCTSDSKVTERPEVIVSNRHLNEVADELVEVLVERNDPPVLFAHAEAVTLLESDGLHPLDHEALLDVLERHTRPTKVTKDGDSSPSRYAADLRKVVLRRLRERLPRLSGLAPAPFMREDGSVCADAGYDESTGLYLLDSLDVEVPDDPSPAEVAAAVAMIDEVLWDFPLPAAADRAHAFSLAITPAVRHLVPLVPLHFFDGNNAGVGKNLLAETLLGIHFGFGDEDRLPTDPMPGDEEEMRKQITSHLAEGRRGVVWDEAHLVIGKQLARLLTSVTWSDRYLGSNVTIRARNLLTCVSLGNQVEVVGDLRRRAVRISVHSDDVSPSRRSGFRHPELRVWAEEHRGVLLGAVLTLLRAWHTNGRPTPLDPLGSFEAWTNIIGGTLAVAGVDGFLDTVGEVLEDGDHLDAEFAEHLADLAKRFGESDFMVRDVIASAKKIELLGGVVTVEVELPCGIDPHDRGAADALGKLYRRYRGRPMKGGWSLARAGTTHSKARWRVVDHGGGGLGRDRAPSSDPATYVSEAVMAGSLPDEDGKASCVGMRNPPIPPHPAPERIEVPALEPISSSLQTP